jgi:uncharacterized sporulation protein YeaH/YhbH (DUF444 family)
MRRIDQDVTRFRRIVKGEIRANLKRYVAKGELDRRQGDRNVSVPLPQINLPKFTFGDRGGGRRRTGRGRAGRGIGAEAGEDEGNHQLEVEVSLDELAQILGEELGSPRIKPRGSSRSRRTCALPQHPPHGPRACATSSARTATRCAAR